MLNEFDIVCLSFILEEVINEGAWLNDKQLYELIGILKVLINIKIENT